MSPNSGPRRRSTATHALLTTARPCTRWPSEGSSVERSSSSLNLTVNREATSSRYPWSRRIEGRVVSKCVSGWVGGYIQTHLTRKQELKLKVQFNIFKFLLTSFLLRHPLLIPRLFRLRRSKKQVVSPSLETERFCLIDWVGVYPWAAKVVNLI